jgi:hypothetical protein
VNKTSQRGFPEVGDVVSKATPGLDLGFGVSLVEMRLSFSFALFFDLGALGVELIVVESNRGIK